MNNARIIDTYALGLRLREFRRKRGLTQEQLSAQIGISCSFYGHIERGTRDMSVETLGKLCRMLNADAEYILFGDFGASHFELSKIENCLREALSLIHA